MENTPPRVVISPQADRHEASCYYWKASDIKTKAEAPQPTDISFRHANIQEPMTPSEIQDVSGQNEPQTPRTPADSASAEPGFEWIHSASYDVSCGPAAEGPQGCMHGGCIGILHEGVGSDILGRPASHVLVEYVRPVPLVPGQYRIHAYRSGNRPRLVCTILCSLGSDSRVLNRGQILAMTDEDVAARKGDVEAQMGCLHVSQAAEPKLRLQPLWFSSIMRSETVEVETEMFHSYHENRAREIGREVGLDFTYGAVQLGKEYLFDSSAEAFMAIFHAGPDQSDIHDRRLLSTGWIFSCFDQALGYFVGMHCGGVFAMTAALRVQVLAPALVSRFYMYRPSLHSRMGRRLRLVAVMSDPETGRVHATADALFITNSSI